MNEIIVAKIWMMGVLSIGLIYAILYFILSIKGRANRELAEKMKLEENSL